MSTKILVLYIFLICLRKYTQYLMKFVLYLFRWQLSTPILYLVLVWLGSGVWQTIIANLIGGCLFFFVDKKIFNKA